MPFFVIFDLDQGDREGTPLPRLSIFIFYLNNFFTTILFSPLSEIIAVLMM
jgi:hypothetical protein